MCELLVYNPDNAPLKEQLTVTEEMYESNPHGLGFVAIYPVKKEDGTRRLNYKMYKVYKPDWQDVSRWLAENNDAWRIMAHARLATSGKRGLDQTHPLMIDCTECQDIKMVAHNGVVSNYDPLKERKQDIGHDFQTNVDSEVIAHRHAEIPDTLEDWEEPDLTGSLNYLVFGHSGIMMRKGSGYRLTEDFRLARMKRSGIVSRDENEHMGKKWVLVKPDATMEVRDASTWSNSYYQGGGGGKRSFQSRRKTRNAGKRGSDGRVPVTGDLSDLIDRYQERVEEDERKVANHTNTAYSEIEEMTDEEYLDWFWDGMEDMQNGNGHRDDMDRVEGDPYDHPYN